MRELERQEVDGVLVVMLTYGPGQRVARALGQSRLPLCLANVQPEPNVTAEWDMADMTYNQGVHGAQDTANALVRAGKRFEVVTDDWRSGGFHERIGRWARAAAAVTAWRRLRVAIVGYAMDDMGDIRVDEGALLRALGPSIGVIAPGELYRAVRGGDRRGGRGGAGLRGRALRDRRAAVGRPSARTTRACRSRSSACSRPAATAPSPRTSTRSATTGASRGCRSPPPRR